jgi:hypothetical protein
MSDSDEDHDQQQARRIDRQARRDDSEEEEDSIGYREKQHHRGELDDDNGVSEHIRKKQRIQASADMPAAAARNQDADDSASRPEAEEDDEPEPKDSFFKSMNEDHFATYEEFQRPDPRYHKWCARCFLAVKANQEVNKLHNGWVGVINYAAENRGKVHPHVFVETQQRMYIRDIQPYLVDPITRKQYMGPPWMAAEVWEHDIMHVDTAKARIQEVIDTSMWVMRSIRDNETMLITNYVHPKTGAKSQKQTVSASKALLLLKFGEKIVQWAGKIAPHENAYLV